MAESTELDLLTALWINVVVTVAFLVSYVVLKKLPLNFRVYYPRRYLEGQVEHVHDLVNLRDQNQHGSSWRSYLSILDWVSSTWSVREADIIEHYVTIYIGTLTLDYFAYDRLLWWILQIAKHWYHSCIAKPNAAEFFKVQIVRLQKEIEGELANVISREEHVAKAGFVSFNSCWGATICAQTQQSRDRMEWVTEWAPEPRDVYWRSLTLNNMQLNAYRLIVNIVVVSLILFFFIPVAFVQSLANLDTLIKYFPFLKSMIQWNIVSAFCQGYLPGLLLRIVTVTGLPPLLRVLTKFEGHISYSKIDKFAASKYYVFMLVNVFFGNVIIGSLFEQLKQYIAAPTTIPKAFGISIPKKATFFMTYIMVDGWANTGAEILRLWPLLKYHVSHIIFVQSEKDQMKILPASPPDYTVILTRLSLYFLLGLVYAIISPLILPFLCIFFAFGYLVYRNQVMNVYEPRYELAASFWPFIHRNIIIALIIKHVTLMGLFSVKKAAASTPFLLPLPILVICFHLFCGQKFLPAFRNYPLQEAKRKDKMNADESIEGILEGAYLHPVIRLAYENSHDGFSDTIKEGSSPCLGKTENCQPSPGSKKDDNAVLSSTH